MLANAHLLGALTSALALALAGTSVQAAAQGVPQRPAGPGGVAPSVSQPVVQPVPGRDGMTLDAALKRLARDPRDIGALIDAGNAALTMGDVEAATGFFRRADQVSPGNPRVKAGLAGAMVRSGDPFGAIPLFEEAEKAGALDSALAADRGLAYDLVGDNAAAQRLYRQSLARAPNDEVVRRLALSYAMSGDKHNAELILSPLLQQRNLAAWRTRAFALAILGQTEEAVSIANTILPSDLASGVAPYLRYMPRLTRAQQAAAANLGAFPRASEIGRDDPRVAQYAPKRESVAAVDAGLTPKGEPLGRNARSRDRNRGSRAQSSGRSSNSASQTRAATASASRSEPARAAPPEPQPARETGPAAAAASPAAPAAAATRPAQASAGAASRAALPPAPPVPTQIAMAPAVAPATAPAPAAPPSATPASSPRAAAPAPVSAAPGFSIAPAASSAPVASPAPAAAPAARAPVPPAPRSLSEAFAEFARPSTDATPAAGAVDLRRIKPSRPKAEKPPEPPKPSHPSRIWVQVATGRDKDALGFDWRRMTRGEAEIFRGKKPFVSAWGRTNRLLTGPFQSEAAANSFIAQLRRADVNGAFIWTSPEGQAVDALPTAAGR